MRLYLLALSLKYSLTMIRTTSGTVLIFLTFLSTSIAATISSVMATVIFCVPNIQSTDSVWHKQVNIRAYDILMRVLGEAKWKQTVQETHAR